MLDSHSIMFLNDSHNVICLNRLAFDDHMELMNKIMNNMLSDLSKITGLDERDILQDYLSLNEYDPIREVLKRERKWVDNQSIVLTSFESRYSNR